MPVYNDAAPSVARKRGESLEDYRSRCARSCYKCSKEFSQAGEALNQHEESCPRTPGSGYRAQMKRKGGARK